MTGIQRHFLGWDTPFLPASGKWLQENCLQRELGSVAGTIVVVSSSEVARRLQSILLERASEDNRAIDMPQIVTPSSLLHLLYEGALRLANSQVLKLATTQALRELPEESIRPLVHRVQQSRSDYSSWISIAQDVNTIAREIESGGHHTDPSTWPDASRMLLSSAAYAKFEAVHIVRCKTRELLQLAGFCFTEDAWCEVLQSSKEISNIILLNLNDMNTAVSSAIQSLSNKGTTVTSVIRAPESLEAHFDSFGRVVPEQWNQKIVPIKEQTISVAGSPAHQAQLFLQQLSKQTEYSSDEVTIAVTNQDAIDSIRLHIEGHSVPTRYAGGHSMLETPELGLLAILHKFLQTKSFASYAELVRNPIVSSTLSITSDEIHHLDAFYKNHMPSFISKNWYVPTEVSKYIKVKPVISLHSKVFPWIEPLLSDTSDVSGSVELVRSFILSLFKDDELDRQSPRLRVLTLLFSSLDEVLALPDEFKQSLSYLSPQQVVELLISDASETSIPEYPNENAVEIVGWLEAMLDDSPCMYVLGLNANLVSSSSVGHSAIPGQLRTELGLNTIEKQIARDIHAVIAMQNERASSGDIRWIVARTSSDGESLAPHPLLFHCESDEELVLRAQKLMTELANEAPCIPPSFTEAKTSSTIPALQIPSIDVVKTEPIKRMSVTSFKNYIACSYRFWLRRALWLDESEDNLLELDYALFGTLVHSALQMLGEDESIRDSKDSAEIEEFLVQSVDTTIQNTFGSITFGTIQVQGEIAKQRLRLFAREQAQQARAGWSIVETERKVEWETQENGESFVVVGTIDRIDKHSDGRVRILDYKTGSVCAKKAHGTKDEWIDLQLPIYRHLANAIGYDFDKLETGYVLIGSKAESVKFDFPDWEKEELECADNRMWEIINAVQAGEYNDEPAPIPPPFTEDLSWICQDSGIVTDGDDE